MCLFSGRGAARAPAARSRSRAGQFRDVFAGYVARNGAPTSVIVATTVTTIFTEPVAGDDLAARYGHGGAFDGLQVTPLRADYCSLCGRRRYSLAAQMRA